MPPGSGRPLFPGPGVMPVASTPPPLQAGIQYRPAGVPPPPVMRIQAPLPSTAAALGASTMQTTPIGL